MDKRFLYAYSHELTSSTIQTLKTGIKEVSSFRSSLEVGYKLFSRKGTSFSIFVYFFC